jgi:FlaA1/EpsC-like NDP-sugar epimerase
VVQLFEKQITNGGPVTVTNPKMMRFVTSTQRGVGLVLRAAEMAHGEEIFIFKMPALRNETLAEVMIEKLAPKYGYNPRNENNRKKKGREVV